MWWVPLFMVGSVGGPSSFHRLWPLVWWVTLSIIAQVSGPSSFHRRLPLLWWVSFSIIAQVGGPSICNRRWRLVWWVPFSIIGEVGGPSFCNRRWPILWWSPHVGVELISSNLRAAQVCRIKMFIFYNVVEPQSSTKRPMLFTLAMDLHFKCEFNIRFISFLSPNI